MEELEKPLTKKERRLLAKEQKRLEHTKEEKKSRYAGLIRWAIGILVVIGIGWYIQRTLSSTSTSLPIPEVAKIDASDHVKGATESAKLLIEYSDFQCPACASYYPLVEKLVSEHGDVVTFAYRHFPLTQHKNADLAARASESASKQGKFWEMHNVLFDRQETWAERSDAEKLFTDYAGELGLQQDQFIVDLNAQEIQESVNADLQSGNRAGVNSTPTFFLNGTALPSIRSYDELLSSLGPIVNILTQPL